MGWYWAWSPSGPPSAGNTPAPGLCVHSCGSRNPGLQAPENFTLRKPRARGVVTVPGSTELGRESGPH